MLTQHRSRRRGERVETRGGPVASESSNGSEMHNPGAVLRRPSAARRRPAVGLIVIVLAWTLFVWRSAPAHAAALTNLNWSMTNNQVGATGVTYSYSFKTATAGTIKTIDFAVSGA